jgi:hypothetical protein
MFHLLFTDNVVPSWLTFFTMMMEVIRSCATLILTGATRRHIPEDGIKKCLFVHYLLAD